MEEYHLKYHDDVYTDRRGVLLPYKRLMGMCCWMGSHFHNWIDYNGVAFLIELLEWGRTFSDFWGVRQFFIFTVSKRTYQTVCSVDGSIHKNRK